MKNLYKEFFLIPVKKDKAPKIGAWRKYEKKKIDFELIKNEQVGIICGMDNLEVLDIDNHFGDADATFDFISDNFDLDILKIPVIKTQGGGYHLYYKCDEVLGSQKIAKRIHYIAEENQIIENNNRYVLPKFSAKKLKLTKDDKGYYCSDAIVETKGIGGYVVYYDNILQGDILKVPKISISDRTALLEISKSLDERLPNEITKPQQKSNIVPTGERLGDKYNADSSSIGEAKALLKSAGWTNPRNNNWRRPGKDTSPSATFGNVAPNVFYNFSENAHPFEARKPYTPFQILALLSFNGDFSACAKSLVDKYGTIQSKKKTTTKKSKNKLADEPIILNQKWQALFDIIEDWQLTIRYNSLTKIIEFKKKEDKLWNSEIEIYLSDFVYDMENIYGIKSISKNKINEMIMSKKVLTIYNPLDEFYNSIPKWDGVDYVTQLCNTITLTDDEDRANFTTMFKKHLIRTLRTAIDEEYTNRMVLVLFGKQEIGKTKIWEWLTPKELYYNEKINLNDKDTIIALSRYLVINFDDLDQLTKKEVGSLKSFISKNAVNKRLSYGRTELRMPRIGSFVGTTNLMNILADENNTRWVILKVEGFDWENYTTKMNPLQIWSQIKHELSKDKNSGELTKKEKEIRDFRNNSEFIEISLEHDILMKHFSEKSPVEKYTASDIFVLITQNMAPVKITLFRLARELRRIFGDPQATTRNGISGRYYKLNYTADTSYVNINEVKEEIKIDEYGEPIPF